LDDLDPRRLLVPLEEHANESNATVSDPETATGDEELSITAGLIIGVGQAVLKVWHVVGGGNHIICGLLLNRVTQTTLKVQNEC
jgi:hypothetical protein